MRSARIVVGVVLLSLLLIPFARGAPFSDKTDIIYKKPAGTMPVEGSGKVYRVVEETFEKITVKPGAAETEVRITIPSKDIDRIEHYDAPDDFELGMSSIQSKNFEQAVKYFDKIEFKKGTFRRPWVKVYVMFYRAEAMREWGIYDKQKNEESVKLYEKLLTEHPNNIFKVRAMIGSAIASVQEEKYGEARDKFKKIKTELFNTPWEHVADLWQARIYEREEQYHKAAAIYRVLASRDDFEMKGEATVGEIRCLSSLGKHARALERARRFVKENTDPRVLGGAWNVIGDCHMARAKKGGLDEVRKARLAYLRTVVVYFFDARAAAEAAFKAGECFERLKRPKRAQDLYKKAVETVGGGSWRKKAEERLKAIE